MFIKYLKFILIVPALLLMFGCLEPDVPEPKPAIHKATPVAKLTLAQKLEQHKLNEHMYLKRDLRTAKRGSIVTIIDLQEDRAITKEIGTVNISDLELSASSFHLRVDSPQDARVRILNIRPKYHDNIYLPAGRYHIEVSKDGFETHKEWINLQGNKTIKIDLVEIQKSPETLTWNNNRDLFTLVYDNKNGLIWALQSAYVDYIKQHKPSSVINTALKRNFNKKLIASKLDTIIYTGNYSLTSKLYSFNTNSSIMLYHKAQKNQHREKIGSLSSLNINATTKAWRLPYKSEIFKNNPFKRYQKYFGVSYSDATKSTSMNLPVRYSEPMRNTHRGSSIAYAADHTKLYSAQAIDRTPYGGHIRLAGGYSLVLPVRELSSTEDQIVFDASLSVVEKIRELVALGVDSSLALSMILGDPKLQSFNYNSSTQTLNIIIYSSSNNLHLEANLKANKKQTEQLKKDTLVSKVELQIDDKKLDIVSLELTTAKGVAIKLAAK